MQLVFRHAALGGALAVLLAACGGDDGGGGTTAAPQTQFGSTFASIFGRSATDDPVAVTASSLGPVSFTTDPVPIN